MDIDLDSEYYEEDEEDEDDDEDSWNNNYFIVWSLIIFHLSLSQFIYYYSFQN